MSNVEYLNFSVSGRWRDIRFYNGSPYLMSSM